MSKPLTTHIGPGITVTVAPTHPATVSVLAAELHALRTTVRELVALTDALQPGAGATMHVRSVQGLARSIQTRLETL